MLPWILLAVWFLGTFPAAYLFARDAGGRQGHDGTEPDSDDMRVLALVAAFWPVAAPMIFVGVSWHRLIRAGYARRARALGDKQPKEPPCASSS